VELSPSRRLRPALRTLVAPVAAALVAAALVAAGLVGCSGTPTAAPELTPPPFAGLSVMSPDRSVALRDLFVPDPGPTGYPAGGSAPLRMQVWNNTDDPIELTQASVAGGGRVDLIGSAATGSPVPGGPTIAPGGALKVPVPGRGFTALTELAGRYLQIRCLPTDLKTGDWLTMTFQFSNGAKITTQVPVGTFGPTGRPTASPPASAAACR
jgi:copper(I)-binding protein